MRRWQRLDCVWIEDAGRLLSCLRKEFPNIKFKFGASYPFIGNEMRFILGFVEIKHPNEETLKIMRIIYQWSTKYYEGGEKAKRKLHGA